MAETQWGAPAREIVDGIHWLGGCGSRVADSGEVMHNAASSFLIVGTEQALLFDTGPHGLWDALADTLDSVLGERTLDWVVPSHPEVPHCGCLARLVAKYPDVRVAGDVRDYHLYYPEIEDRLRSVGLHEPIDLGGGFTFTLVDAVMRDLPNTVWGHEGKNGVLFVADAFQYMHHAGEDGALHRPGECRVLSSELPTLPTIQQAQLITRAALAWTRLTDANRYVDEILALIARYPTRLVAPTHGNVIDDLDPILPIMRMAYRRPTAA
jgi:hypothetical protein